MGKYLLYALGLALTFATSLRADVTVSDGSVTNFQTAFSNLVAAGGGTITVTKPIKFGDTNGTVDEQVFDGESLVTVSGGNTNAIFIVQSGGLTLSNLTISGGVGTFGGAISIASGAAGTFLNCTFSGNHAIGSNGVSAVTSTNGSGNIIGKGGARGTAGSTASGGAIFSQGDLALFLCKFLSNSVVGGTGGDGADGQKGGTRGGGGGSGGAGGTAAGGAVCSLGPTLVVSECTFSGNSAQGGSGGIGGVGGSGPFPGLNGFAGAAGIASGGGLYTSSTSAMIESSTFDNNTTQGGDGSEGGTNPSGLGQAGPRGGDALGAGVANIGTLNVTNSTFYQNSASGGNGGDGGVGGAKGGAGGAGGSAIGGGIYNSGTIVVVNCTFSKGDATGGDSGVGGSGVVAGKDGKAGGNFGGNVGNVAKKRNTGFTLANSIIGEATSGKGGYGKIADGGYNLSADKSIKFKLPKKGGTSLMDTNALEGGGDIGDNGGPTETIALAIDSKAVNYIPLDLDGVTYTPPTSDQRGLFDRPIGAGFEVGAYELDPDQATIIGKPVSTNVIAGSNAVFSVTAGGTPPFTYQWFFNDVALLNGTNSILTITNAQTTNQGPYKVVVANDHNSVTSAVVTLTVNNPTNSPPTILTEPPIQVSVFTGSNAVISVTATSTVPLFYQWVFLPVGGVTSSNVLNGTNATLTITNAQASDQGQYQVGISNAFGFTNSSITTLFVTDAPADTNTPPGPTSGVRGKAAKPKVLSQPAGHKSVSMNEPVRDAEPNGPARKQFAALGNSFPEPRRNVISSPAVAIAFNRRLVYS